MGLSNSASPQAIEALTGKDDASALALFNTAGGLLNSTSLVPDANTVITDNGKTLTVKKKFTSNKLLRTLEGTPLKRDYNLSMTFDVSGVKGSNMFLNSITNIQAEEKE
jgi:hypothetical protein